MPDKYAQHRTSFRPESLLLAALLALSSPSQSGNLPDLPNFGDTSGNLISPIAERRLGQAFMRSIRASEKVLDDPLTEDYLNQLGRRLTHHTPLGEDNFHFFVIDDPSVNAFAGPGGYIGIHSGLILTTRSESELAAVLAHEIAHVTQRHLPRSWQAVQDTTVPQTAILIAAAVLGATVSPDAGLATALGGQAALIQQQIDFTRANEHEADRVGINLLAQADFEPHAMAAFFTRMGRANRDRQIRLPEFLQTHPVTTDRIAEAMDRASDHPYRQPEQDLRYQLLRMRLQSQRGGDTQPTSVQLEHAISDGRYRSLPAARYALALAHIQEQNLPQGMSILNDLMAAQPDIVEYTVSAAEALAQNGQYTKALALLGSPTDTTGMPSPVLQTRCRLLLEQGHNTEAMTLAEQLITRQPDNPDNYNLAARAHRQNGRLMTAHEYLASHYYLKGDTEAAITQLEIALRIKGLNFYDASRLESRLELFRRELVNTANSPSP